MGDRNPVAMISGAAVGSMVVCADGTTWILKQTDNRLHWDAGPPIPEQEPVAAVDAAEPVAAAV